MVPVTVTTANRGGRPVEPFNQPVADEIVERLSAGEFLNRICEDPAMPSVGTVFNWGRKFPKFAESVAQAREAGSLCWVEQGMEIAMTPADGRVVTYRSDGSMELRREDAVQARKLAAWALFEGAKKICPNKFGDKVALTGGSETDAPIKGTMRMIEEVVVRHERLTE